MKKAWILLGQALFWLLLPAWYIYLRFSRRTRVLLVKGDKALVVKGWINDGRWSLPGGGLHGDEDPMLGAMRELIEETGIDLSSSKLTWLGQAAQRQNGLHFNYYQFWYELTDQQEPKVETLEITEAVWLPITSLNAKNAQQHVLDTLAAWRAHR